MLVLDRPKLSARLLSRRMRLRLGALQKTMEELASQRQLALRMLMASRDVTTAGTQREYWLEFSCLDQEYRVAVHRLAQFCREQEPGTMRHVAMS